MAVTEKEMRDLILRKVPTHFVTYQELWVLCGSPLHPDNRVFDKVLVSLTRNDKVKVGVRTGRYPLKTYASR